MDFIIATSTSLLTSYTLLRKLFSKFGTTSKFDIDRCFSRQSLDTSIVKNFETLNVNIDIQPFKVNIVV